MGVAHHSAYLPWLEIARTELVRAAGMSYAAMESQGTLLVIVKAEVNYRRPVKYDDVIEIRTRVDRISRVKIEHSYDVVVVERSGEQVEINACTARTVLASVNRDGEVTPLPAALARRARS
jgi:acyl-CoA thioester hydrolase